MISFFLTDGVYLGKSSYKFERKGSGIHTITYPPAHPVTIIPIATSTLVLPNTKPTTVGMVLKSPPFATPLIITNAIGRASVLETSQRGSILRALSINAMNNV